MIVIETQILNPNKEKRLVLTREIEKKEFDFVSIGYKKYLIQKIQAHANELIKAIDKMSDKELEESLL